MTTARRTSLVRHLRLDIGYEQDVSPGVLASAILEALEPELVDEMGIVFLQTQSDDPGHGTITIYAPVDQVKQEKEAPPQTPAAPILALSGPGITQERKDEEKASARKPNVG